MQPVVATSDVGVEPTHAVVVEMTEVAAQKGFDIQGMVVADLVVGVVADWAVFDFQGVAGADFAVVAAQDEGYNW